MPEGVNVKVSELPNLLSKKHPDWFKTGKPPGYSECISYLWDFHGKTVKVEVFHDDGVKRIFLADIREKWYQKLMKFLSTLILRNFK